ncbi:hypothetical protein SSAG_00144 [Streptomyces sp. Mg1]|nr:hypothetical protein SSAG_00144 [Streptomyces sp. Mg1]
MREERIHAFTRRPSEGRQSPVQDLAPASLMRWDWVMNSGPRYDDRPPNPVQPTAPAVRPAL